MTNRGGFEKPSLPRKRHSAAREAMRDCLHSEIGGAFVAMILPDHELARRIEAGEIGIDPAPDMDQQIQPASVDLRLGHQFVTYRTNNMPCIDVRDLGALEARAELTEVSEDEGFVVQPGDFVLGTTFERVTVPRDLVARVEGRSSIGRLAVVVHATAGFVDPGFEGFITLELSNLGRCAVKLYPRMRVCQLVFHTMTSPVERAYGAERGSKYQGQTGPVASRIAQDFQKSGSRTPRG